MIIYHGSTKKFDHFTKQTVAQPLPDHIDTIGFWFTSDIYSAKPFAIGSETVIERSKTEFWDDAEPKVVQYDRPVRGFIYKVYIDEPNLKRYESYDLFMSDREGYCDYFSIKKRNPTWRDHATLLNKEEANNDFRKSLQNQGYEGFLVQGTELAHTICDMYCIFSEEAILIADIIPVDELGVT